MMPGFDPRKFDPSKMDPKLMMELSQLMQKLPGDQISRMQTLMHNMMAGFDVKQEMEEFEKSLPLGFREKLMAIMAQTWQDSSPSLQNTDQSRTKVGEEVEALEIEAERPDPMDLRSARITILSAVAEGRMTPDEAEKLLFH